MQGFTNTESSWCTFVQFLSSVVLKQLVISKSLITITSNTDSLTEAINNSWSVTTASQTLNGVQAWIIPPSHMLIIDKFLDFTLTQNSV